MGAWRCCAPHGGANMSKYLKAQRSTEGNKRSRTTCSFTGCSSAISPAGTNFSQPKWGTSFNDGGWNHIITCSVIILVTFALPVVQPWKTVFLWTRQLFFSTVVDNYRLKAGLKSHWCEANYQLSELSLNKCTFSDCTEEMQKNVPLTEREENCQNWLEIRVTFKIWKHSFFSLP